MPFDNTPRQVIVTYPALPGFTLQAFHLLQDLCRDGSATGRTEEDKNGRLTVKIDGRQIFVSECTAADQVDRRTILAILGYEVPPDDKPEPGDPTDCYCSGE